MDMILLIAALILVFIIGYVVVVPILFLVDTDKELYTVVQPGVFSFQILPGKDVWMVMRIMGFRLPLKKKGAKEEKRQLKERQKSKRLKRKDRKRKSRSLAAWRFLVMRIVRALKVRRFELDIDTDDFALNAQLVPLFHFINRGSCSINVNFAGRNYFAFAGSVRLVTIAWAYLLFLTKK